MQSEDARSNPCAVTQCVKGMGAVGVGQREDLAEILEEPKGLGSWGCQGEILGLRPGRRSGAVGRGLAGCGRAAGPPRPPIPFPAAAGPPPTRAGF